MLVCGVMDDLLNIYGISKKLDPLTSHNILCDFESYIFVSKIIASSPRADLIY